MKKCFSIGLMSGTSMDGIDAALLETDGLSAIKLLETSSLTYPHEFHLLLKACEYAVKRTNADLTRAIKEFKQLLIDYIDKITNKNIHTILEDCSNYLYQENKEIKFIDILQHSTDLHIQLIEKLLKQTKINKQRIAIIGYHGQTLYHDPYNKITIQVGDADKLHHHFNSKIVHQFRSADIECGGQGAPLAPIFHQGLALRDKIIPLAVVNCGGIANLSLIYGAGFEDMFGFDCGPGNALIDRFVKQRTHAKESMDTDGHYGLQGNINPEILNLLEEKSCIVNNKNYYHLRPSKSLDINDLQLIPELQQLNVYDGCRTLADFTAKIIVKSLTHINQPMPNQWVLAGGGWNNPNILESLKTYLKPTNNTAISIKTADEIGWNNQYLEAQLMAYLAVRSLHKLPITFPNTTGVKRAMTGGIIIG